jgi:hypothetical protein
VGFVSCTALERLFPGVDLVAADADCRMLGWRKNDAKAIAMARRKRIALVAHDNKKEELVEWAKFNSKVLAEHSLYSTSATGQLLKDRLGLKVTLLESGPLVPQRTGR